MSEYNTSGIRYCVGVRLHVHPLEPVPAEILVFCSDCSFSFAPPNVSEIIGVGMLLILLGLGAHFLEGERALQSKQAREVGEIAFPTKTCGLSNFPCPLGSAFDPPSAFAGHF